MARRNDHSREEIKEMALKAATDLISEHGLDFCSARKIAGKIEYTVGTLYNVFKNYDDLIFHVNGNTLDDLGHFMSHHLDDSLSGADALKRLAALYIVFVEQKPNLWNALFDHRPPADTSLPEWYQEKIEALFSMIEEVFLESTNLDDKGAARAARVLWAGMHGICSLSMTHKLESVSAEPTHILAENFIDNYMSGIVAG